MSNKAEGKHGDSISGPMAVRLSIDRPEIALKLVPIPSWNFRGRTAPNGTGIAPKRCRIKQIEEEGNRSV